MVYCGECGAENPEGKKFCWKCGKTLFEGTVATTLQTRSASIPPESKNIVTTKKPTGKKIGWIVWIPLACGIIEVVYGIVNRLNNPARFAPASVFDTTLMFLDFVIPALFPLTLLLAIGKWVIDRVKQSGGSDKGTILTVLLLIALVILVLGLGIYTVTHMDISGLTRTIAQILQRNQGTNVVTFQLATPTSTPYASVVIDQPTTPTPLPICGFNQLTFPCAIATPTPQSPASQPPSNVSADVEKYICKTYAPNDVICLSDTLTAEEKRMLRDALEHLRNCAPALYNYVRSHVTLVTRGTRQASKDTIGYVLTGESTIYLPQGTMLGDNTYMDSARTFLTAANLVHEARHIELGDASTEQDAYKFELQVYIPQCYPNDIDPAVFVRIRQDVENRSR